MANDDKGTQGTTAAATPASTVPTPSAIKAAGKEYGSVDDLVKAYESANQELGRWTQQHGDLKKQYDEAASRDQAWQQWWQTVQPYWGEDVENVIRQKMAGRGGQPRADGTPAQAAAQRSGQPQATSFEGFEFLRPEEQVARLQQAVAQPMMASMNKQLTDLMQTLNQTLAQKEQYYQSYLQNHLSLMRRALEKKMADPNFNVDQVMENAARAISGQIDPIELGQQLLSAAELQSRVDAARTDAYEQGKKDKEQELANKQMETVTPSSGAPPAFKPPVTPGTYRHGLTGLREKAAESLVKKFGAGLFTRE